MCRTNTQRLAHVLMAATDFCILQHVALSLCSWPEIRYSGSFVKAASNSKPDVMCHISESAPLPATSTGDELATKRSRVVQQVPQYIGARKLPILFVKLHSLRGTLQAHQPEKLQ